MPRGITGSGISYKIYNCLNCGKDNKSGHSKTNKYCDATCKSEYDYKTKYIFLIEQGKCSDGSRPLKRYILERDNFKCVECGCGVIYNNKPLSLHIDHIDGNSDNNFPINLRTLCPNCHSQTENFGSKGKGNRYKKITKRNEYLRKYKSLVEPRG